MNDLAKSTFERQMPLRQDLVGKGLISFPPGENVVMTGGEDFVLGGEHDSSAFSIDGKKLVGNYFSLKPIFIPDKGTAKHLLSPYSN